MTKIIQVTLDPASIDRAIRELEDYKAWLQQKANELAERLAHLGQVTARANFDAAVYDGDKGDISVEVEQRGENTYAVVASGTDILFLEFGAGITNGYGHPQAGEFGYGPGTWPDPHYRKNSKGELVPNWMNDRGWYLPEAKGGGKTFGNPPNACMYHAARTLEQEAQRVAQEVFRS